VALLDFYDFTHDANLFRRWLYETHASYSRSVSLFFGALVRGVVVKHYYQHSSLYPYANMMEIGGEENDKVPYLAKPA